MGDEARRRRGSERAEAVGLAGGLEISSLQGGRGRAEAWGRAGWGGGLARASQFAEARERAERGGGGAQAAADVEFCISSRQAFGIFYRGSPGPLPRPTREPRSHHLARRAALAAGGYRFRGTRRRRQAVRRRAGCSGAWTRGEAGGVPVGDASEGEEGCNLTLTDGPDSLQRLALTATSRHGTGRAEGGASAGRGGVGLAGGRHPGTRSRRCTRLPTGMHLEYRATPLTEQFAYGAPGRGHTS